MTKSDKASWRERPAFQKKTFAQTWGGLAQPATFALATSSPQPLSVLGHLLTHRDKLMVVEQHMNQVLPRPQGGILGHFFLVPARLTVYSSLVHFIACQTI